VGNKGYTSCGASVDWRFLEQEDVRHSFVSGHRFVNLVHKHSYGFVHPKPNTLFQTNPARRYSHTVSCNAQKCEKVFRLVIEQHEKNNLKR
jgi:hypothetical protein